MKTLPLWGRALEALRADRSLRSMQTAGLIGIPQYKRMISSKLGPSVALLDRWLTGMKYTWHDWADAYEDARRHDARVPQIEDAAINMKHRRSPKKNPKLVASSH